MALSFIFLFCLLYWVRFSHLHGILAQGHTDLLYRYHVVLFEIRVECYLKEGFASNCALCLICCQTSSSFHIQKSIVSVNQLKFIIAHIYSIILCIILRWKSEIIYSWDVCYGKVDWMLLGIYDNARFYFVVPLIYLDSYGIAYEVEKFVSAKCLLANELGTSH